MADVYLVAAGFVQKFGDKDAVTTRDVNGQTVRDCVIKTVGSQKLTRITIWPELNAPKIVAGDFLAVEGKYSSSGDNNQFHNISAYQLNVNGTKCERAEREVVNASPATEAPAAAATAGDAPPPF